MLYRRKIWYLGCNYYFYAYLSGRSFTVDGYHDPTSNGGVGEIISTYLGRGRLGVQFGEKVSKTIFVVSKKVFISKFRRRKKL